MLRFLREHVWSELPAVPSRRDRLIAAALWGLGLPIAFGAIHAYRHRGEPGSWSLLFLLLPPFAALGASVLVPGIGNRVYLAVMRLTATIGFVVSQIVLVLFFFLVVTPLGLALRALGKSSVDLGFRTGHLPRWKARAGAPPPARYHRLF